MTEATTQENSLRDHINASFEAVQEADESVVAPASTESAPAASESTGQGYEPPAEEKTPTEAQKEYKRDEEGKFADEKTAKAVEGKKEGITPAPKAGQPKEKLDQIERAPQAWKPEAREFWNQIPEAARREILRTEQSIQQTLRETAEDRRFASAIKETIRPFEYLIKAENGNPIQAIDNLMSTAARLRTGNVNDVAGLVTEIVNQFGIGRFGNQFISSLDAALVGKAPQQQVDPYVAQMEQRVRQMEQTFQKQQYQQTQQVEMGAQNEVTNFMQNAEFGNDLREEMADQIELAAQRGQALSLQDAYDRACWANPEIRNVLTQRQERERAQQTNQVAQTARRAAVSVGGSPAFNASQESPNNLRDAIEFAMRR
jgi:hypothetical protein